MTAEIARSVEITRGPRLLIDGIEVPWVIAEEGPTIVRTEGPPGPLVYVVNVPILVIPGGEA